jgi:RHS repeat-associated protein
VSNPWQFASGYFDATTGLYKFGTRYYSPTLGRWTQQDPVGGSIGQVGSGNAYVYAGDAPVMQTDPSGRLNIGAQLIKACIEGAIGTDAVLLIAAALANIFSIVFIPITIAALLIGAASGCLGGAIVAGVSDALDYLFPS